MPARRRDEPARELVRRKAPLPAAALPAANASQPMTRKAFGSAKRGLSPLPVGAIVADAEVEGAIAPAQVAWVTSSGVRGEHSNVVTGRTLISPLVARHASTVSLTLA